MEMSVRLDEGAGHPVVLLHGFPGNGDDWKPVAERLDGRCRVIICDLLGFGASPRPTAFDELWADAQSRALAATLDRLGIDQVALVGHDMGGGIAVSFTRDHRDRVTHLGLLSTNAFGDTPVDFPLSLLRLPGIGRIIEPAFLSKAALNVLGQAASRTRGIRAARNDAGEARAIRTLFGGVLRNLPELYEPIERALGQIEVPTTVLWGDRDMFFRVEQGRRTADAIPGAAFVPLEGCGHFTPIERPDQVAQAIADLVDTKPGPPRSN